MILEGAARCGKHVSLHVLIPSDKGCDLEHSVEKRFHNCVWWKSCDGGVKSVNGQHVMGRQCSGSLVPAILTYS